MGRNDDSHLANIFLHMYEKTYFEHLQENYQSEIIAKFGYPYMFQDDLNINNIYPKEMVIKNNYEYYQYIS